MAKNVWPFKAFHLLQFKRNIRNAIRHCCTGNTKGFKEIKLGCEYKRRLQMSPLLAMVFVSYQQADIQNIQEIWLPFQASNSDLFPSHAMFIWPRINVRHKKKIMLWWKWNMLFDFLIHIYSINVIRRKWYSRSDFLQSPLESKV